MNMLEGIRCSRCSRLAAGFGGWGLEFGQPLQQAKAWSCPAQAAEFLGADVVLADTPLSAGI
jgi:hypothetical protein